MKILKKLINGMLLFTIAFFPAGCSKNSNAAALTVSVASSLKASMEEIKEAYQEGGADVSVIYNFGSSGSLQQQILQGAEVDIFIPAAVKQMDELEDGQFLEEGTRVNLLGNRIVLIMPVNATGITEFNTLTDKKVKKIALGDPKSVPVGQYAQEILDGLGMTESVKSKLVYGNDVRQVLTWVETGNADAGIVYETDAAASGKVKIAAYAPEGLHKPVIYPAAVLRASKNLDAARKFMKFLQGEKAKAIFKKYRFTFLQTS